MSADSEAKRVSKEIEGDYYVSDVEFKNAESAEELEKCAKQLAGLTKAAFMLIAAGLKKVLIYVHVPEDKRSTVSALEWVNTGLASMGDAPVTTGNDGDAHAELLGDPTKNRYPIKMKDTVRGSVFAWLRKKGAIKEADDDEPVYNFNDL